MDRPKSISHDHCGKWHSSRSFRHSALICLVTEGDYEWALHPLPVCGSGKKNIQAIPFQFSQKHKEKGIMFNTTLQNKHTSKIIIISIDKRRRGFLIVPSSSPFVFAPVAPGSPPEGLFLFMASHSTSMFPINVSTALLNASFGRWSLGDLGDFPSDLEGKPGKQHCYENDHI